MVKTISYILMIFSLLWKENWEKITILGMLIQSLRKIKVSIIPVITRIQRKRYHYQATILHRIFFFSIAINFYVLFS